MKYQKLKGTVTIPPQPHRKEQILPWANAVTKAIQQLRDRLAPMPSTRPGQAGGLLPFEVYTNGTTLVGSPGTIDNDSIPAEEEVGPANGDWYFEANATINASTGAITGTAVGWVNTPTSNTSTDFYTTLAFIEVASGEPDLDTLQQYNYGPIFVLQYGAVSDAWAVALL